MGGSVRDLLLGLEQKDVDVSVVGDGVALAELTARETGATPATTGRFGTATLLSAEAGVCLDFVTARKETYPFPGALPVVEAGTLADDLARRDFTINALAVPIDAGGFGSLVDPHGGLADLEARLVRVLHSRSFRDDPTRIFRAVKLSERLGFTVEHGTLDLIRQAVREGALATISTERAVRELLLIMEEPNAGAMLRRLDGLGALAAVDPELAWKRRPEDVRPLELEQPDLSPQQRRNTCLAAIAADYAGDPQGAEALARRLHLQANAVRLMRDAAQLAQILPRLGEGEMQPSEIYRLLHGLDIEAIAAYGRLATAEQSPLAHQRLTLYLTTLRHVKPQLKGDYLHSLGIEPGPVYGRAMSALRDALLDGVVQSSEDERRFLHAWLPAGGLPAD